MLWNIKIAHQNYGHILTNPKMEIYVTKYLKKEMSQIKNVNPYFMNVEREKSKASRIKEILRTRSPQNWKEK